MANRTKDQHSLKRLGQLGVTSKTLMEDKKLRKFQIFHSKQVQLIKLQQKKQLELNEIQKKKFRDNRLQNTKKSTQFRQQWQQVGKQKWSVNVSKRRLQHDKDLFFKSQAIKNKLHTQTMAQFRDLNTLANDINKFQKIVLKKQDSDSSNQKKQYFQPSLQKNLSKLSSKLGITGRQLGTNTLKKKRNLAEDENQRHQRQKKRRKMIVEQNKRHKLIDINRQERYIVATIEQTSKQQKQLQYQIWRVWQNKQIISQNRKLVDDKIKEKQQTRTINNKFKNEQLLKTYRLQHEQELKAALVQQKKFRTDYQVQQRKSLYSDCNKIIEQFISMTESCYEYEQQINKQQLDEAFLEHLLNQFIGNATDMDKKAQLELKNYVEGKGQWKIDVVKGADQQPTSPIQDNALPLQPVNNYYLGNILKTIFSKIYNSQENTSSSIQTNFIMSLIGLQFAGKHSIAQQISQRYQIKAIYIDKLISKRIQQYYLLKDRSLEISKQTLELVNLCYDGKDIPNSLIIMLLEQQIRKNPKSIIVDYPITYQQAIQLTKLLSNIEPKNPQLQSRLQTKINQFSRLVKPTQSKIVPRTTKSCGIDTSLWIDIDPKVSLDRFLGRRWVEETVYHINDNINDQLVNSLKVGDKASQTILRNNFKLNNKEKLKHWLEQFGLQLEDKSLLKTWQSIKGQSTHEQVKQQVFKLVDQALKFKQKFRQEKNAKIKQQQADKKRKQLQKIEKQQLKGKCISSSNEQIKNQLLLAQNSSQMNKQFLEYVSDTWNKAQNFTINCLLEAFKRIRLQQVQNNSYIAKIKRLYIQLLTRSDQKFYLVKQFQTKYNEFYDTHKNMINYQETKQQLHQRIFDLEDQLFNIIEIKKDEAIEQRNNIINSGWLQFQLERFIISIQIMLQVQLQRSNVCQQLITDFYTQKYMLSSKQVQQVPIQINIDYTLEIIKQNTYPRLQKLISETLRLFNKQEEQIDDKNKKGGKAAKKQDKKAAKKGQKQQIQQKQPKTEQIELKKALNTEKSIFRYRLNIINSYAIKKISKISQSGKKLYSDLQDLYLLTNKVQNKSVFNATKFFKIAIENEQKIENEIQLNYVHVIETQKIRNFEKPQEIILKAKQEVKDNRFTITNLNIFVRMCRDQAEGSQKINTKRFIALLLKFITNQSMKKIIPSKWKILTSQNIQFFVKLLDPNDQGFVQLSKVFIFAILSDYQIPKYNQIRDYKLAMTNFNDTILQIDKEKFVNATAWFDKQQATAQNVRIFKRDIFLKELLFEIFKHRDEQNELIHVDRYLQCISLASFTRKNKQTTYYQYAFIRTAQ